MFGTGRMSHDVNSFGDLYIAELQEIRSVEGSSLGPAEDGRCGRSSQLKQGIQTHLEETRAQQSARGHLRRHKAEPREHVDQAMRAMLEEAKRWPHGAGPICAMPASSPRRNGSSTTRSRCMARSPPGRNSWLDEDMQALARHSGGGEATGERLSSSPSAWSIRTPPQLRARGLSMSGGGKPCRLPSPVRPSSTARSSRPGTPVTPTTSAAAGVAGCASRNQELRVYCRGSRRAVGHVPASGDVHIPASETGLPEGASRQGRSGRGGCEWVPEHPL